MGRCSIAVGIGFCWLVTGVLGASCCYAGAQEQAVKVAAEKNADARESSNREASKSSVIVQPAESLDRDNRVGLPLLRNIAEDQKAIWIGPKHLRFADADWLVPLGGATAAMFATDTEFSKHLSNSPSRIKYSKDLSNYGLGAMGGVTGGLWLWGHMTHDDHKIETGVLAGEAAIDSMAVFYPMKYAFGRERPQQDAYRGRFGVGGNSFPSAHATLAWSMASVIAHEYPGPLTSLFAYGLASAVSTSRITGKQHFPSDVLIGSAIGWLEGMYVYRKHHDSRIGGGEWATYSELYDEAPQGKLRRTGSTYVELDSWVYPAMERLSALGYINTAFLGLRPWTRIECARLLEETGDEILEMDAEPDVRRLYGALVREFEPDSKEWSGGGEQSIHIESLYSRVTNITGQPLNDSYHFGQTIINDYGRPYQEGFNSVNGFSAWSTKGRFAVYVRGEYQHAPSTSGFSDSVRTFIADIDQTQTQPRAFIARTNEFRLLDTYVAANVAGWDLTFGKQSLWWGPGNGSSLTFSNNAEPIYMARSSRIVPLTLPWILAKLGPMKVDLFFGKLSDNQFPPRPLIHGEKISFKPTQNLELEFSKTTELGGVGRALTPAAIWNSYVSFVSSGAYGSSDNPGKRTGGFDFSYRVPFVRKWVTLYSEWLSTDDPSPVDAPRRAAINSGIYMPRLPGLRKLDLRVEAGYTDTATSRSVGGKFVYWELFYYHNLYLNKNKLIGSWLGREGVGYQAWSTYSFGTRNTLQVGYRHAKVDGDFIPGGETVNDGSAKLDWWLRHDLSLSTFIQYEKWTAPLLAPVPQTNWTSSVGVFFWPRTWSK
jgi:Capsule assembly protein Wzi/PAP2 superfamily